MMLEHMAYNLFKELETELYKMSFNKSLRKNINDIMYPSANFGLVRKKFKPKSDNICSYNKKYPRAYQILKDLIKIIDKDFKYTSIIINKNNICKRHIDGFNISNSYIFAVGDYTDGELVVEKNGKDIKYDIKYLPLNFNGGNLYHYSLPFTGQRYSIVYYQNHNIAKTNTTDGK